GDAVRLRAGADGATATLARTPATRVLQDPDATYASVTGLQLDIALNADSDAAHDAARGAATCDSLENAAPPAR
ncbi:MAG: hypothetical protein M3Q40_04150, partial [Pseudomonadota bacterium]|nr:hypothetical protein [Pseudomonadota bacterium]